MRQLSTRAGCVDELRAYDARCSRTTRFYRLRLFFAPTFEFPCECGSSRFIMCPFWI
jgi:hypothetical protein